MKFYTSISHRYRHIFPFNPQHLRFTKSYKDAPARLMEVGCGVGDLARAFARDNYEVVAIDGDPEMIELAARYNEHQEFKPEFLQMDMRTLSDEFADKQFDIVTCYGNTLAHMLSEEDIEAFLCGASKVLKRRGVLLLQILNYDYILNEKVFTLPLIDNEVIRFERRYVEREDGMLDFNTILFDKESNEISENSIILNPIRKDDLKEILIDLGFEDIEYYSNFKKADLQNNQLPLVIKATNR